MTKFKLNPAFDKIYRCFYDNEKKKRVIYGFFQGKIYDTKDLISIGGRNILCELIAEYDVPQPEVDRLKALNLTNFKIIRTEHHKIIEKHKFMDRYFPDKYYVKFLLFQIVEENNE